MLKITDFQKKELVKKYNDCKYSISKRSIPALQYLNQIDLDANLTEVGINTAISELSLINQASSLGLKIEEYLIDNISKEPENNLLYYIKDKCKSSVWAEGRDILLGIHACALKPLKKLNSLGKNDAITRYVEAQFTINQNNKAEILDGISKCSFEDYLVSYKEVYNGICSIQDFIEISEQHMILIYEKILTKYKNRIAELIFRDPYKFRKGWPDLTVFYDDTFKLIEVKHNDRLISSQIYTIPELKNFGIEILIGKVKYRNKGKIS